MDRVMPHRAPYSAEILRGRRIEPFLRCRTSIVIALPVGGCTALPRREEPNYSFSPRVADADVKFHVIDRRPTESKGFRVEEEEGVRTYIYGDRQFFPERLRV